VDVTADGRIDREDFVRKLGPRTKAVSFVHASNALGTINPAAELIRLAHGVGAVVLLDGCQSAPHFRVDVAALGCDFFVFSGHKVYGPTGVGVLYGKRHILDAMPPYQGGGEMIKEVRFDRTTYNELPYKFEAGTPNIADVVALKYAFEFINDTGKEQIRTHEDDLLRYASQQLREMDGLRIIGDVDRKVSVLSFVMENIHTQDIAILLDNQGIAVRTGHHCTQPLMHRLGIPGTTRASFAVYNTRSEVDSLVTGLLKVKKMLG
jgi:cysteine desulfurase/selenocysteine lyase